MESTFEIQWNKSIQKDFLNEIQLRETELVDLINDELGGEFDIQVQPVANDVGGKGIVELLTAVGPYVPIITLVLKTVLKKIFPDRDKIIIIEKKLEERTIVLIQEDS